LTCPFSFSSRRLGHVLGENVMPASSGGYEALVAEYIIGPLGLSNTGFNYSAQVLDELAVG
jgi:CubicO group peptidase (beta-lactamase class C family)